MTRWRMRLHPDDIAHGAAHSAQSLGRGYVGLDLRQDVGDPRAPTGDIEPGQLPYRRFASSMAVGDLVLVQLGFAPFALVEVSGVYEHVPHPKTERGVWFRHMRAVRVVRLYDDYVRSGAPRERIFFRSTLLRVLKPDQPAFRLIERWRNAP